MTAVDHRRPDTAGRRLLAFAAVADVVVVLLFVGIGRHAHDHGVSVGGMASTAWPFVAGTATGWLVAHRLGRRPATLRGGAVVWLATVVVGMVLRVVAGQGTAFSFILVALAFLGLFLLGWRLVALAVARRR